MKMYFIYDFKLCRLGITEDNGYICRIYFDNNKDLNNFDKKESPLIKRAAKQLDEYFCGRRKLFDLPLSFHGTDFQVKVWSELQNIPYGETRSYGEIAAMAGNSKASRAVGIANNRNPVVIVVPCHRVIGADGNLTGFAGGLEVKKKLLELEGICF